MADRLVVRLVVISLGAFAFLIAAGAIYLTGMDKTVPGELWTLAGGAVGALGAILSRPQSDDPVPVVVQDEPIRVTQTPAKRTAKKA